MHNKLNKDVLFNHRSSKQ